MTYEEIRIREDENIAAIDAMGPAGTQGEADKRADIRLKLAQARLILLELE